MDLDAVYEELGGDAEAPFVSEQSKEEFENNSVSNSDGT